MDVEIFKLIYKKKENEEKTRIFGENFIANNKNKCVVIYKNKKIVLKEYMPKEEYKKEDKIKIKILLNNGYNLSYMFKNCENLLYISCNNTKDNNDKETDSIENNDNIKIIKKKEFLLQSDDKTNLYDNSFEPFQNPILFPTSSISSLISYFNEDETYNSEITYLYNNINDTKYEYTIMNEMFYNCSLLESINSISDWNTKIIININKMFFNCRNLLSLPDISKWNTEYITDMSGLFYNCISLKSIPDISNWSTEQVRDLSFLFYNCSRLLSIPDISKWNTSNVTNMARMFYNCSTLLIFPDISYWNTYKVFDLSEMFCNCSSLNSLPDISNWITDQICFINEFFSNCSSLTYT